MQADLGQYQDRYRLLVFFAPSEGDVRLVRQQAVFRGQTAGMRKRQLLKIVVLQGSTAPAGLNAERIRRRYHVVPSGFEALLVGKDGTVAYRTKEILTPKTVFARIDGMPMRRDEIKRQGRG